MELKCTCIEDGLWILVMERSMQIFHLRFLTILGIIYTIGIRTWLIVI